MKVPNETSRSPRRPWAIAVAILVAVPLTAGIVQAAIPDANTGEITVCYKPYTGQMRLIDTESVPACASDETELSWNQQGPPGPPGLSGLEVKTDRTPDFNFFVNAGNSDSPKEATAECDAGSRVIGTAVNIDGAGPDPIDGGSVAVDEIIPINNTQVRALAYEIPSGTTKTWALTAYAFCATVQP